MVTGNEYVFDDIGQALAYLLENEQRALKEDLNRRQPPIMFRQPDNMCLASNPALKPIPFDSLDYSLAAFFNDVSDDKFVMTRLCSGRYSLKPNLCHRKYLFRGETEFHSPCRANMFRNLKQKRFTKESMKGQELILLMLSHPLVQLLDLGIELCGKTYCFEMNCYGLAQHYYNKTALLDLTSNPEVATFFATTTYDEDNDLYSAIVDPNHAPGVLYYYTLDINKDFTIQNDRSRSPLSTIGLQVFPRSDRQKGFLYNQHPSENFNNVSRLNAVLFKHNADIAKRIYQKFSGGEKLFPEDILKIHWNTYCKGNDIISNRTLLLNQLFNPNMTLEQVEIEARSLNIDIQDYIPSFTDEELAIYYDAVWNHNFWGDFCDKIHIPGDKDGKMKRDLLDIPNNPQFEWAFVPNKNHLVDYSQGYLLNRYQNCLK